MRLIGATMVVMAACPLLIGMGMLYAGVILMQPQRPHLYVVR